MPFHKLPRSPSRIKDLCLLLSSLLIFYLLLLHNPPPLLPLSTTNTTPTALRHLFFTIAASSRSLPSRKPYLRLWFSPNATRALIFLDRPSPLAGDPFLPPILTSADTSAFPYSFSRGSRSAIRIARIVKESVLRNESGVRWYVFGDDDTVFFPSNLVRALSKYDHNRWYYIGSSSEGYVQNAGNSFEMAFGGGGFAISASLARVLAGVMDSCLFRYPHLYGSDARVFACVSELGVGLTREPGFHQVDVRGDIFGLLAAHPLSPLLSLHHLDRVHPIFPNMTMIPSLEHLFKAVNVDPGRVLQQTVCYDHLNSLTVSIAWGYAIQVFEGNYLLPDLIQPQRTFSPWRRNSNILSGLYVFNTREYSADPCKRPVVFFLESIASGSVKLWADYTRHIVGNCSRTRAVTDLEQIRVFSQKLHSDTGEIKAPRRQCCDIVPSFSRSMVINIRQCGVGELISMRKQP
ncbi:O-fucosylpeptide 3-beta-N-acetylglucosaminyltransferase [Bertholletia excelsa]